MKLFRILTSSLALAGVSMVANAAAPRYVFYFIGDGMGMGHVMTTQTYNRMIRKSADPLLMMQFPVASMCMTYSASSPVTDSAAAGTALACGHKTKNGMLGMDADSTVVYSISHDLLQQGYGVGIITSVYQDDATPGAHYAHVASRKMYYDIDCHAAESGFQFIGGAGLHGGTVDGQPTDAEQRLTDAGYTIVSSTDGIEQINSEKIYLVSPDEERTWNIGYTIDSIPTALNLPDMTRACLKHLERVTPQKFFMMVEGGNIDHAAHANDGGAVVKEIINFNEALQVAYDFYLQHPDETLIVVTADHDTGGMALNNAARGDKMGLRYIDAQKKSKEEFSAECKAMLRSRRVYQWEDMRQMLEDNFGFWSVVPVSDKQTESLKEKFESTFELRNSADQETLYASFNAFAVEVFKVLDSYTGIAWTTTSHTGNPVPVFAIGVGADQFKGLNNNIEIPGKIMNAVD
ncbi:MAG: alkaline phosphatase [Muribaculaceae bacterium]|nr:alkaline phosphatase [Muribaculaceae bacterium]